MHALTRQMIDRAPPWARPGIELAARTANDTFEDRVPGLAAEVAFYLVLSLPPLLLTVLGCLGYVGEWFGTGVAEGLRLRLLEGASAIFTPPTVNEVVRPALDVLLDRGRADVASFGIIFSLYASSLALHAVLDAVLIAYDMEDRRPAGWKRRLKAIAGTVVAILTGLVVVPLLVVGPRLGAAVAAPFGVEDQAAELWRVLYWPAVAVLATGALTALYHFGAYRRAPFRRDLPGAVLAMVVWLAGSFGLRYYASLALEADLAIYRHFSAPLVLLLWLYVSGFAILLGAEMNAEIEKMWPTRSHRTWRRRSSDAT